MLQTTVNGKHSFAISKNGEGWTINGDNTTLDAVTNAAGIVSVLHKGRSYEAIIESTDREAKEVCISIAGQRYKVSIQEPMDLLLQSMGLDLAATKKVEAIKAPMPGMILKILVTPGQQIQKGDGLIVLEAMKMENVLKAPGTAVIKSIRVQERTAVEKGAVLIDLE